MMTVKAKGAVVTAILAAFLLAGCGETETTYHYPESGPRGPVYTDEQRQTVFGEGGLSDLFGERKQQPGGGAPGIAVNSFLWRASLDTIAFMPLVSADPFGGVIITDWYTPPEAPDERYKMSVYILGRELRADGVRVSVFRQRLNGNGAWITSSVSPETATNLENEILTRARQMRLASANVP